MTPLREVLRSEPDFAPTRGSRSLQLSPGSEPPSHHEAAHQLSTTRKRLSHRNLRHQLHHHIVSVRLDLTSATEAIES